MLCFKGFQGFKSLGYSFLLRWLFLGSCYLTWNVLIFLFGTPWAPEVFTSLGSGQLLFASVGPVLQKQWHLQARREKKAKLRIKLNVS